MEKLDSATEGQMDSDFAKARSLLMRAHKCLGGNDDTSRETAEALEFLVINLAAAECSSLVNLRPLRQRDDTRHSMRKKITA
jgi:hypothetical protein